MQTHLKTTPLCKERSSILGVKPFKRKITKKLKIEKYCKNPLVYTLKITLLRRRVGEVGDEIAVNKFVSLLVLNRRKHCNNGSRNPSYYLEYYVSYKKNGGTKYMHVH
jgi:hypothetical protein